MSLSQINELSRQATVKAARAKKQPVAVEREDFLNGTADETLRQIPFLGDYKPVGWSLIPRKHLYPSRKVSQYRLDGLLCDPSYVFVDASGFGEEGEGALTFAEFVDLASVNPGVGWSVVEAGQFQIVVAAWKKRASKSKR
jgi:hypothetical protein